MKRMIFLVLVLTVLGVAETVIDAPGVTMLWNGDTLKKNTTLVSGTIWIGHWPYPGITVKTSNPADSTNYRVYFLTKNALSDSFFMPSDTLGNEAGNTIFRLSDTLAHSSTIFPVANRYLCVVIKSSATLHGNRARLWVKLFLWSMWNPDTPDD